MAKEIQFVIYNCIAQAETISHVSYAHLLSGLQ